MKTAQKYTPEEYEAAIPKCCSMSTFQEHLDILLCWSLSAAVTHNKPMNCGACEMRNDLETNDKNLYVNKEEQLCQTE